MQMYFILYLPYLHSPERYIQLSFFPLNCKVICLIFKRRKYGPVKIIFWVEIELKTLKIWKLDFSLVILTELIFS